MPFSSARSWRAPAVTQIPTEAEARPTVVEDIGGETEVFDQDAVVLKLQTETLQRFGEPRYVSTEIDLLGPKG